VRGYEYENRISDKLKYAVTEHTTKGNFTIQKETARVDTAVEGQA